MKRNPSGKSYMNSPAVLGREDIADDGIGCQLEVRRRKWSQHSESPCLGLSDTSVTIFSLAAIGGSFPHGTVHRRGTAFAIWQPLGANPSIECTVRIRPPHKVNCNPLSEIQWFSNSIPLHITCTGFKVEDWRESVVRSRSDQLHPPHRNSGVRVGHYGRARHLVAEVAVRARRPVAARIGNRS